MANFNTHITVAAMGGGLLATSGLSAEFFSLKQALVCWGLTTLGGILPDIDSDNSSPVKLLFNLLGLIAVVFTVIALGDRYAGLVVWLASGLAYVAVRYLGLEIFARFTVHRGLFHSLLAGLFFWFAFTASANWILGVAPWQAWLQGSFLFIGFLIHLTLDELYSVDLGNVRIKRSFGSAFKLFDYSNLASSGMLAFVVAGLFWLCPGSAGFVELVSDEQLASQFWQGLLSR